MRVLILFVVAALAQKSPPLDAQGRPLEKPDKELFNAAIEAMKKLDIDPKEVMTEDKHLDTLKEKLPEDQYNAVVLMIKQRPPLPKGMPKGPKGPKGAWGPWGPLGLFHSHFEWQAISHGWHFRTQGLKK